MPCRKIGSNPGPRGDKLFREMRLEVGSTRSQPIKPSAAIGCGEPAGRPRGGSGERPAQQAVFLQAGDVSGLLPPAGVRAVVDWHFWLLSGCWLVAPKWDSCPKPCHRLETSALARRRSRNRSGSGAAIPVSVLQIPGVSVDGYGHPRWAPVQTDARQSIAAFLQIACLRDRQQPPGLAGRQRASLRGRRRGSAR
jgi:hypothetical protein